MDLFSLLLQIHIAGAAVMALLLTVTVGSLLQATSRINLFKNLAVLLALSTLVEVVTGSAMYLVAADASLVSFCAKMAIYLSLTAVAEYALVRRIQKAAIVEI